MKKNFWKFLLFFLFFTEAIVASIPYDVKFIGVKDKKILKKIEGVSQLVNLNKRPPRSINALRYRADGDIPEIIKVLHSYGYYDASVTVHLTEEKNKIIVIINILPNIQYTLSSYKIYHSPCNDKQSITECNELDLEKIGMKIDKPAMAEPIINSRLMLLTQLSFCGYPLAEIDKQDIVVDAKDKDVAIKTCVNVGPICHFGPTTMVGLSSIKPLFIARKIRWKEGQLYSPSEVEETQKKLLSTNLFSSVLISHDSKLDEEDQLPMKIHLTESKHKNINVGVSYATIFGMGVSFGWSNRNFRQVGELLSIEAEISQKIYTGTAMYKIPDFKRLDQDYVFFLQAVREKIHSYQAQVYSVTNRIDRKVNDRWYVSWGLRFEFDKVTHSPNNGDYTLVGIPIYVKYSTANSVLNPTRGFSIIYRPAPWDSFAHNKALFFKQVLVGDIYIPFSKDDYFVFATRILFGSIVGPKVSEIPMTKLFFGGSAEDLRGYRYKTVSPRNDRNSPLGGRGAIYFSFEPRILITKTIGIVPFFDIGTVSSRSYPNIYHKWYKSTGIGLRYFTFFGPLRLDVGFPLNRRKDIDPRYRIYISIGQTF